MTGSKLCGGDVQVHSLAAAAAIVDDKAQIVTGATALVTAGAVADYGFCYL
jgi:hypothetical protein